ncbi:L-lactate dehydrogenase [Paenibacillus sacheonensis]|uniref:L-lactate dehydrogenase n=1 Tax=Paenibacillus sacheonensis TaxID=742054 RepID=A0A7X4YUF4_9BACL|nr:L-lactate dehydrogenase [Paenibacillus sacheonensis]MBM7567293.1 L-lactate dehydrogenase [Paenibacillus sacheonensis]NBC72815.1 L-lactate dehydrogenase [Paenibacillus sacheonensis]
MGSKARKVVIVGVGYVGSTCAYSLINQAVCDEIMLVDRTPERAYAQALDLSHCMEFVHARTKITTGTLDQCGDADIVVLSVGIRPKNIQSRLEVLESAYDIHKPLIGPIMASGFDGIFLVASNPVDIVTHMVWRLSGLPRSQVFGTGTSIDSSRLKTLLSYYLAVDPRSVSGYVLGEHGDSQFPVWSHVTVGGKPLLDIIKQHPARFGHLKLDEIARQTMESGLEIYKLKGSTYFGIGNALAYIIRSILNDEHRIIAVSAVLDGEYGFSDLCLGVPAIIARCGMKEIVELNLTPAEQEQLARSGAVIQQAINSLPLAP